MKIGVFRRRFVQHGGGERFAREFVRHLAMAGHEVHLFCERWSDPPAGVTVHRVPGLRGGAAASTLGYACFAPRRARAAGIEFVIRGRIDEMLQALEERFGRL